MITIDRIPELIRDAPTDFVAKAHRVFLFVRHKTTHYDQWISISPAKDYPIGYCKSEVEFRLLLKYLSESRNVIAHNRTNLDDQVKLTIKGIEESEADRAFSPLTIFISSTCYDLLDLRAELADLLELKGHTVKLSEDPARFNVDPTDDSIECCLRNLEMSDVVLCVLDRRYGGVLKKDGISAIHKEIRHARQLTPPKPIYSFVREQAMLEYSQLRKDNATPTQWVEPKNPDQRNRWKEFAEELIEVPITARYSNWVTPFKNSVDLKRLVLRCLADFQRKP